MKRCIILGRTNVGKTLFVLNFAAYLGASQIEITFEEAAGRRWVKAYALGTAAGQLTSAQPHMTKSLQTVTVDIPGRKVARTLALVDTCGLIDGIHRDVDVRRAMAQTLATVRDAGLILHMVDAAKVGDQGTVQGLGEVDYQVAQFAQMRGGYAILANKMDLPMAEAGLSLIRSEFTGHEIIPISALQRHGFREVRRFVYRHI